ncbi:MAG TPA: hypothetical protein VIH42_12410 [Thermoguttaceae bacterium]
MRSIQRRYGIAEEAVEEERAKWQRRYKPGPFIIIARLFLLGISVLLGGITAYFILAGKNPLTQVAVGMLVFCLLVLFYWVMFQGVGRILFWTAGKIKALVKKG